jgi:hypothetical protein
MAASDYLERQWLKRALNGEDDTDWPVIASVYMALWKDADPGEDGSGGNEVSGGSYARVQVTGGWTVATDGANKTTAVNTSDIVFPTATANWGTQAVWPSGMQLSWKSS